MTARGVLSLVLIGYGVAGILSRNLECDCLHPSVRGLEQLVLGFVVEQSSTLLYCPLQLSGEDPNVLVGLKTITVRQDVNDKLRGGHPETTVSHGSQAYGDTPSVS